MQENPVAPAKPIQQPPDPKRALYDTLVQDGYDLGGFDAFTSKLALPEKRRALFDAISNDYEFASFEDFDAKLASAPSYALPKSDKVARAEARAAAVAAADPNLRSLSAQALAADRTVSGIRQQIVQGERDEREAVQQVGRAEADRAFAARALGQAPEQQDNTRVASPGTFRVAPEQFQRSRLATAQDLAPAQRAAVDARKAEIRQERAGAAYQVGLRQSQQAQAEAAALARKRQELAAKLEAEKAQVESPTTADKEDAASKYLLTKRELEGVETEMRLSELLKESVDARQAEDLDQYIKQQAQRPDRSAASVGGAIEQALKKLPSEIVQGTAVGLRALGLISANTNASMIAETQDELSKISDNYKGGRILTLEDVSTPSDLAVFMGQNIGASLPGSGAAMLTLGSNYAGTLYMEAAQQMADRTGEDPIKLIRDGKVSEAGAIATAGLSTALDYAGAKVFVGGVKAMAKSAAGQQLLRKVLGTVKQYAKSSAEGAITEGAQSLAEQAGTDLIAGSPVSIDPDQVINEMAVGAGFGASGVAAGKVLRPVTRATRYQQILELRSRAEAAGKPSSEPAPPAEGTASPTAEPAAQPTAESNPIESEGISTAPEPAAPATAPAVTKGDLVAQAKLRESDAASSEDVAQIAEAIAQKVPNIDPTYKITSIDFRRFAQGGVDKVAAAIEGSASDFSDGTLQDQIDQNADKGTGLDRMLSRPSAVFKYPYQAVADIPSVDAMTQQQAYDENPDAISAGLSTSAIETPRTRYAARMRALYKRAQGGFYDSPQDIFDQAARTRAAYAAEQGQEAAAPASERAPTDTTPPPAAESAATPAPQPMGAQAPLATRIQPVVPRVRVPSTEKVKKRRDFTRQIADKFKSSVSLNLSGPLYNRAFGTYDPKTRSIGIEANSESKIGDVLFHEVGHALDRSYPITDGIVNQSGQVLDAAAYAELEKLYRDAGSPRSQGGSPKPRFIAEEGFAEFVRGLLVNPTETLARYPALGAIYNANVGDDAKIAVSEVSKEYLDFVARPAADYVLSQMMGLPDATPPPKAVYQGWGSGLLGSGKPLSAFGTLAAELKQLASNSVEALGRINAESAQASLISLGYGYLGSYVKSNIGAYSIYKKSAGARLAQTPTARKRLSTAFVSALEDVDDKVWQNVTSTWVKVKNLSNAGRQILPISEYGVPLFEDKGTGRAVAQYQGKDLNLETMLRPIVYPGDQAETESAYRVFKSVAFAQRTIEYGYKFGKSINPMIYTLLGGEVVSVEYDGSDRTARAPKYTIKNVATGKNLSDPALIIEAKDRFDTNMLGPNEAAIIEPEKNNLTGIAEGGQSDFDVATQVVNDFDAKTDIDPDMHQRVLDSLAAYRAFSEAVLDYAYESGLISQESFEAVKRFNPNYINLTRVEPWEDSVAMANAEKEYWQGIAPGAKTKGPQSITSRARGGGESVGNIVDNLLRKSANIIERSNENYVLTQMVLSERAASMFPDTGVKQGANIFQRVQVEQKGVTFTIYENGDKQIYRVRRPNSSDSQVEAALLRAYAAAIQKMSQVGGGAANATSGFWAAGIPAAALKMAMASKKIAQASITLVPKFIGRNFIRDKLGLLHKSRAIKSFKDYFVQKKMTPELERDLRLHGVSLMGVGLTDKAVGKRLIELALDANAKSGGGLWKLVKKIPDSYLKFADKAEFQSKGAEAAAAVEEALSKGATYAEAINYGVYMSDRQVNFKQSGSQMREINKFVPFANAQMQGILADFEFFTDEEGKYKFYADPRIQRGFALASSLVLMEFLNDLAMSTPPEPPDEEELAKLDPEAAEKIRAQYDQGVREAEMYRKERSEQPQYLKDLTFGVKFKGAWFFIPKAPGIFSLYGSYLKRTLNYLFLDDKNAMDGLFTPIMNSLPMVSIVESTAPNIEAAAILLGLQNELSFTGAKIIPKEEEDLAVPNRPGAERASRFAQTLNPVFDAVSRGTTYLFTGKGGTGYDARRLDAAFKLMGGDFYKWSVEGYDAIAFVIDPATLAVAGVDTGIQDNISQKVSAETVPFAVSFPMQVLGLMKELPPQGGQTYRRAKELYAQEKGYDYPLIRESNKALNLLVELHRTTTDPKAKEELQSNIITISETMEKVLSTIKDKKVTRIVSVEIPRVIAAIRKQALIERNRGFPEAEKELLDQAQAIEAQGIDMAPVGSEEAPAPR